MKNPKWMWSAPMIAAAVLLTGCKDEAQTLKIKQLEEEASGHVSDMDSLNQRLRETEEERNKLRDELDQAKRTADRAKDEADRATRQMEAMRKIEEAARENARKVANRDPVEDAKKIIQEKLAAVWQIEGDQGNCRGIVCEVDGKTWLYFPATSLKGSLKLTVKDAAGTAVTKFGELQIATDANLVRLEIKQEVPIRFTMDAKAELGDTTRMFLANPAADGGALKLDETRPSNITPTEVELNAYGSAAIHGLPVFNAETGTLLTITVPTPNSASDLWATALANDSGTIRAARLNRSIEWKPSNIGTLLTERRKIDELNKLTRLVSAAAALRPGASGLQINSMIAGSSQTARQIFEENKTFAGVQDLFKLDESLSSQKHRSSEADIKRQFSGLAGSIGSASRRTATELKAMKPSPCNRTDMEAALKWNEAAIKKLDEALSSGGR